MSSGIVPSLARNAAIHEPLDGPGPRARGEPLPESANVLGLVRRSDLPADGLHLPTSTSSRVRLAALPYMSPSIALSLTLSGMSERLFQRAPAVEPSGSTPRSRF